MESAVGIERSSRRHGASEYGRWPLDTGRSLAGPCAFSLIGGHMTIPKAIVISAAMISAAVFLSALILRPERYHLINGATSTFPYAWRIDQQNGYVALCSGKECRFPDQAQ